MEQSAINSWRVTSRHIPYFYYYDYYNSHFAIVHLYMHRTIIKQSWKKILPNVLCIDCSDYMMVNIWKKNNMVKMYIGIIKIIKMLWINIYKVWPPKKRLWPPKFSPMILESQQEKNVMLPVYIHVVTFLLIFFFYFF